MNAELAEPAEEKMDTESRSRETEARINGISSPLLLNSDSCFLNSSLLAVFHLIVLRVLRALVKENTSIRSQPSVVRILGRGGKESFM